MTLLIGAIAAAIITAFAAMTAAWISRSIKIAEFRQDWIDELMADISTFIGVAEEWFRKWEQLNDSSSEERGRRVPDELFPIANRARVIFGRIKLRFNPESNNPSKKQDDKFLQSLSDLLNRPESGASWFKLADDAVEEARKILKREWEVTKKIQLPRLSDFELRKRAVL